VKLHLATAGGQNIVTGYGKGFISVNGVRYQHSLIVMPERAVETWQPADFSVLGAADFELIAGLKPEIVLLGTGSALRFPHPSLSRALTDARIGMEVMDTGAACRTYNVLAAEGRQVAAALLIA